jgi:hypothetical protein
MENNSKPTMFQTTLTWGLITGFAGVVYTLILYFTDMITNQSLGYVGIIISIVGIYLGTKAFRDQSLGGFISYGKALGTGVMISLFAAIISVIFMILLYTVIDTELVDKMMAIASEKNVERGISEDQAQQAMEMGKKLFIPFAVVGGLFFSVFVGFIISLITSAILKKEGDSFNRDMASVKSE